jgi:hypothetical protein
VPVDARRETLVVVLLPVVLALCAAGHDATKPLYIAGTNDACDLRRRGREKE